MKKSSFSVEEALKLGLGTSELARCYEERTNSVERRGSEADQVSPVSLQQSLMYWHMAQQMQGPFWGVMLAMLVSVCLSVMLTWQAFLDLVGLDVLSGGMNERLGVVGAEVGASIFWPLACAPVLILATAFSLALVRFSKESETRQAYHAKRFLQGAYRLAQILRIAHIERSTRQQLEESARLYLLDKGSRIACTPAALLLGMGRTKDIKGRMEFIATYELFLEFGIVQESPQYRCFKDVAAEQVAL